MGEVPRDWSQEACTRQEGSSRVVLGHGHGHSQTPAAMLQVPGAGTRESNVYVDSRQRQPVPPVRQERP
jgi:calcineurin-like phosphoesterase family protein